MGADRFIATHSGGKEDFKPYARSLDLIIATTNDEKMPLDGCVFSSSSPSFQAGSSSPSF
jgi:hypothetical protein